ncbi:MAG: alpha-L-rhamnosidase C-terminal domain-containing protein, partial [Kiritimatiellia bacterium]
PEYFDPRSPNRWTPGTSVCHSYASLAGVLLQQMILGGRVEGRRVTIAPWFGNLAFAKGVIPTLAGGVQIAWRRRGKEVELDVKAPKTVEIIFKPRDEREKINFLLKQ